MKESKKFKEWGSCLLDFLEDGALNERKESFLKIWMDLQKKASNSVKFVSKNRGKRVNEGKRGALGGAQKGQWVRKQEQNKSVIWNSESSHSRGINEK